MIGLNYMMQSSPKLSVGNIFKGSQLKDMEEKIKTLSYKVDKIMEEIGMRIKREMLIESGRIFDGFKTKLKHSISTIEDQLQFKVDQIGLLELARQLEKKMNEEIKLKIGVDELRKNNNNLTRKIDDIQNKISKTLVDTLIDLQTEEAPLIMKTNKKLNDKCISCDQYYKHGNNEENKNNKHGKNNYIYATTDINKELISIREKENKDKPNYSHHYAKTSLLTNTKAITNQNSQNNLYTSQNFIDDKRKFNNILTEELDKVNVNSSKIINAANHIISKSEKVLRKGIIS